MIHCAGRRLLAAAALAALVGPAQSAEIVAEHLSSLQGIAPGPQSSPFITSADGGIAHLVALGVVLPLVNTGGSPHGIASDAAGDLLVADAVRHAILKITQWGAISEYAAMCGGRPLSRPVRLAIRPGGGVYFADAGTSRVCRADQPGAASVVASGLVEPSGLAVTPAGALFVATAGGRIWKLQNSRREVIATLTGPGAPAGIAVDEAGRLYIGRDGGGRVSVLGADGSWIEDLPIPGSHVADVAFAGSTFSDLYVTEPERGALYRISTPHRSQRLPWEADPPLAITEPVDGAILNRHDGDTTAEGLRIMIKGRSRVPEPVRVNGSAARVRNGQFETTLVLRDRETTISAEAGSARDRITVLWDRGSYPRYRLSTDDNIWFLRDIARHAGSYQSIFDNSYLAFWREMHRKYGTKVHFNIYYETAGFNLSQMPDRFRPEWQQNADWIRLTFHARANEPDRPYVHASPEKIRGDYRLVTHEIERFAGKELSSPATTVHWGVLTRAAARALREQGVRVSVAYFDSVNGLPDVCLYLPAAQWRYLMNHDYWKDMQQDLVLIRHDMVINLFPVNEIVPRLEQIATDPHQSEVMELMIHEQYFYPDYVAYEPDYRRRVETAIRWVTEHGYKPVLYDEGFLGVPQMTR